MLHDPCRTTWCRRWLAAMGLAGTAGLHVAVAATPTVMTSAGTTMPTAATTATSKTSTKTASVGTVAWNALPGDLPAGLSLGPDQVYQLALESRTERDYRRMLVLLRHAAGSGHLPAQEMLGSVLVGGPALYGQAVPADRCEAARWARLAMLEGSEVGRHQLLVLNGLRDGAASGARCGPGSAGAAGRR